MDLSFLFSGLGGAALSASVTLYVSHRMKPKPTGLAYELTKKMRVLLQKSEAEYYFMRSAQENYDLARLIYTESGAEIIATSFNENPENYGEGDLARCSRNGSLFTRITCEEVCSGESIQRSKKTLGLILRGAKLVVVPRAAAISKIDGMFCRFSDSSSLCMVAFRDPANHQKNRGCVFRDGIADGFFDYYKGVADFYPES